MSDAPLRSQRYARFDVHDNYPSCFIDTPVVGGAIGIGSCTGGGARIEFGDVVFVGGFDGDRIDVCSATTFDWSDGCRWGSAQRIVGSVKSGTLSFTYNEAPLPGETGCVVPCSANAVIEAR